MVTLRVLEGGCGPLRLLYTINAAVVLSLGRCVSKLLCLKATCFTGMTSLCRCPVGSVVDEVWKLRHNVDRGLTFGWKKTGIMTLSNRGVTMLALLTRPNSEKQHRWAGLGLMLMQALTSIRLPSCRGVDSVRCMFYTLLIDRLISAM